MYYFCAAIATSVCGHLARSGFIVLFAEMACMIKLYIAANDFESLQKFQTTFQMRFSNEPLDGVIMYNSITIQNKKELNVIDYTVVAQTPKQKKWFFCDARKKTPNFMETSFDSLRKRANISILESISHLCLSLGFIRIPSKWHFYGVIISSFLTNFC